MFARTRRQFFCVLVGVIVMTGCQSGSKEQPLESADASADAADAAGLDAAPPVETEWLVLDEEGGENGKLAFESGAESVYQYVRFEVERPVRITALRGIFQIPASGEFTVYIWDDFGGNRFNFDHADPLAEVRVEADAEQSGEWLEVELDEPVELVPGRMFYAGVIADGDDPAQLFFDEGQEVGDDEMAPSLVWLSARPPNENGFPRIGPAPGDFRLRAQVELFDTVPEAERTFEVRDIGELGLAKLRRAAVADVDADGDPDVMLNGGRLFLNDGSGSFTDATGDWMPGVISSNGGVFGDYDNDGDPDYFATGKADRLLKNEGDRFVDVTDASGIDDTTDFQCGDTPGAQHLPTEAAAWFDYDNDGFIDLYQANYHCSGRAGSPAPDKLWRNKGDGSFAEVALPVSGGERTWAGRGVAPADVNADGFVEILVTNYRLHPNYFFSNLSGRLSEFGPQSQLRGVETVANGRSWYGHSIGATWGDIDHDGRLDVFVANLAHPRFIDFSQKSTLYRNVTNGVPLFADVTDAAGIRYLETPSNPTFWDYDNDADLDLFFTCVYDGRTSQFYRNDGHPEWTEVSYQSGARVHGGWGAVTLDVDLDGDLDLLVDDKAFINRNPSGAKAVYVRLEGAGAGKTNRDAIGARVMATIGDKLVVRERYGAHGTGVQDSPWLQLGLGQADEVDLVVEFPASGETIEVDGVAAGSRIVVSEEGALR